MQDISPNLVAAAAAILAQHAQTTVKAPPSNTPTTFYGHGPGGLFSAPALERPLFSAMLLPRQGVLARIPVEPNRYAQPLYGIITGQTSTNTTGESTMGPCDDPPSTGLLRLCSQTRYFGRQSRQTRVLELDRIGLLRDRGEHSDFQWIGNPLAPAGTGATAPSIPGLGGASAALNNEVAKVLMEFAVAWARDFAREVYTGNPTNNSTNGGRRYFRGLDLLINTGYRDALSDADCPAADSIVRNAPEASISGGEEGNIAAARTVYRQITDIYRQLQFNAGGMGLSPVRWGIAMRPGLFYELTEVWPMVYATTRGLALATSNAPINTSAEYLLETRDRMRGDLYQYTGQYLMIDGQQVEVILDDAIPETALTGPNAGSYRSSIYFIPFTVLGGLRVLTLEYVPYTGADGAVEAARAFGVGSFYQATDDGRFLWHFKPPTNYCVQFLAKTEPTLVLRTPYLAARYTGVTYTPISHERNWDQSGPNYVDGGSTTSPAPTYNTPTP